MSLKFHRSLTLWCQPDLATHSQTVAVMVSYDSILCDLCGDEI